MASCEEYELLISQSLDGELTSEEELFLQAHLESCHACRELFQELLELQASFSTLTLAPPPTLHTRIMDQIQLDTTSALPVEQKIVRPATFHRRYATTAAALVILVSAVVFGSKLNLSPPEESTSIRSESAAASPEANLRSLPESTIQAESPDTITETKKPTSIQDSTKKPVKPSSTHTTETKKTPKTISLPPETMTESPPSSPPECTTKGFSVNLTELSQSDAEELLIQKLTEDGQIDPKPIFSRLLEDSSAYLFLYTDSQGLAWVYSVSCLDGSIERSASLAESLSTLP